MRVVNEPHDHSFDVYEVYIHGGHYELSLLRTWCQRQNIRPLKIDFLEVESDVEYSLWVGSKVANYSCKEAFKADVQKKIMKPYRAWKKEQK